jgi:hypothetical protein
MKSLFNQPHNKLQSYKLPLITCNLVVELWVRFFYTLPCMTDVTNLLAMSLLTLAFTDTRSIFFSLEGCVARKLDCVSLCEPINQPNINYMQHKKNVQCVNSKYDSINHSQSEWVTTYS